MLAHEIMSRHVITVDADATIAEAAATMLAHRIGGLPVVDSTGKLVGMLSESDLTRRAELGTDRQKSPRWLLLLTSPDQAARDFMRQTGRKVRQVMTPCPITIAEDTSLDQIVQLMESHGYRRFPVVRGGSVVGMVTRRDFVSALANFSLDTIAWSDGDNEIRRAVTEVLSNAAWRPCGLHVAVHDGVVTLGGIVRSENVRKAALAAADNVPGVKRVEDQLTMIARPPSEEEYGGGDFVSLQTEPSTDDDQPL